MTQAHNYPLVDELVTGEGIYLGLEHKGGIGVVRLLQVQKE